MSLRDNELSLLCLMHCVLNDMTLHLFSIMHSLMHNLGCRNLLNLLSKEEAFHLVAIPGMYSLYDTNLTETHCSVVSGESGSA